jgi:hypothetical protein
MNACKTNFFGQQSGVSRLNLFNNISPSPGAIPPPVLDGNISRQLAEITKQLSILPRMNASLQTANSQLVANENHLKQLDDKVEEILNKQDILRDILVQTISDKMSNIYDLVYSDYALDYYDYTHHC